MLCHHRTVTTRSLLCFVTSSTSPGGLREFPRDVSHLSDPLACRPPHSRFFVIDFATQSNNIFDADTCLYL